MVKETIYEQGKKAKQAARILATLSTEEKNKTLQSIADELRTRQDEIVEANEKDLEQGRVKGLSDALIDRLLLNSKRIDEMSKGLEDLINLPDPIGEVVSMWTRPNGLQIGKMRVPMGVIGIIYEARPNVTVDAAGLCLKTGNAVILRGGSEAFESNKSITKIINSALMKAGLPKDAVQLVKVPGREAVDIMLKMNKYLDVLIPRGGAGLIQNVVNNATVPVIETGTGNCHVYVDNDADLNMAERIVVNAKVQRPGVCNAMETLLVHKNIADKFLPQIAEIFNAKNVEIRGCTRTKKIIDDIREAVEEDWSTEFLDYIIAIKVVDSIDDAINHISEYSSKHSEAIITNDYNNARYFQQQIDAAAVYVNASTRFTDGAMFGFGAEIGISTQKLHARGPMGPNEITTFKYIIFGNGQIRE